MKLCALLIVISVAVVNGQEVETKTGKLKGTTVEYNGKKVNKFIGIPYAEPPLGPLRFKEPKPKEPWPDVLDVTGAKEPPLCVQINQDNFAALLSAAPVDPRKEIEGVKITGGALALGKR